MPVPVVTPTRQTERKCSTCTSALVMTGHPSTFVDLPRRRDQLALKGWVPSLLVTVCPVCDARIESDEDKALAATAETVAEGKAERKFGSFLERFGREHDQQKEGTDAQDEGGGPG